MDKIADGIRTINNDLLAIAGIIMHRQYEKWYLDGDNHMQHNELFGHVKLEDSRHEKTVDELRKVFAGKVVTMFGNEYVAQVDCDEYNRRHGE